MTETSPPGEDWRLWIDPFGTRRWEDSPYHHLSTRPIELWRKEWGNETSFVSSREQMHPAMNVADLFWRPA